MLNKWLICSPDSWYVRKAKNTLFVVCIVFSVQLVSYTTVDTREMKKVSVAGTGRNVKVYCRVFMGVE